jgi:hypothetical protein
MPAPSGAYNELLSTTLRDISTVAIDNARKQHPLFETLRKNYKSQPGGAEMQIPVILGEEVAPTFTSSASGVFNPAASDNIITSAVYDFAGIQIGQVRIPYLDLERNTGKNQIIDRLATHREALIYQFQKSFAQNMHVLDGDRVANSYLSLDSLCNDAVEEVGGIDYTTSGNGNWRPVTDDTTGDRDIKATFRKLFDAIRLNSDGVRPDVCHVGKNVWDLIREYLDDVGTLDTVGSRSAVEFAWESIRFEGVEVRWDYDCPNDRIYALYTPALHWRSLNDNFMKVEEPQRVYVTDGGVTKNSLDMTYPVVNVFSVGTNQRRALGLITGVGVEPEPEPEPEV